MRIIVLTIIFCLMIAGAYFLATYQIDNAALAFALHANALIWLDYEEKDNRKK